jgi:hypothetical protein
MPNLKALLGRGEMVDSKQDFFHALIWTLAIVTVAISASQIKFKKREHTQSENAQISKSL